MPIIDIVLDFLNKHFKTSEPAPVRVTLGSWDTWDESVHRFSGQAARMQRAVTQNLQVTSQNASGSYTVVGSTGNSYSVGYESCTCKDFERRRLPCKHMYKLVAETADFNPVPYFILIDVPPHPNRGYMNLGKYRVTGEDPDSEKCVAKIAYAEDEQSAIMSVRTSSILVEPFSVKEMNYPQAKEEDIASARALGAYIPDGVKAPDVKASIRRFNDRCETTIGMHQWKYAARLGVQLSALAGESEGKEKFGRIHKRWYSEEDAKKRLEK